jgi:hypothetical protein
VLPLTLGYIAGYGGGSKEEQGSTNVVLQVRLRPRLHTPEHAARMQAVVPVCCHTA